MNGYLHNGRRDRATRARREIEATSVEARSAIHHAHVAALKRTDEGRRLTLDERREQVGIALVWLQTAENHTRSLRAVLEREALRLEEVHEYR